MELWSLISKASSIATLIDFLLNKYEAYKENLSPKKEKALMDSIIDYSVIAQDIHSVADKVDIYISHHYGLLSGSYVISDDERNTFYNTFFNKYPSLIYRKSDIIPFLREYLDRLELVLQKELSFSDRVLLNSQIESNNLLKHILRLVNQIYESAYSGTDEKLHIRTDNYRYSNSFCDTLFLHKGKNDKVNLQNLFVLPKYQICDEGQFEDSVHQLDEEIKLFLQSKTPVMFIEGDAGSGKSSIVSWMCYHYCIKDQLSFDIFGNKTLITIRLRDMDRLAIQKSRLVSSILTYLGFSTIREMVDSYPDAVVLLDGFDELCMLEGISNYESLLDDLFRKNLPGYKYIITSRPKYLDFENKALNIPKLRISLNHFDKQKRQEWLSKYTNDCGERINGYLNDYILSDSNEENWLVCDTPMSLYMVSANNVPIESLSNQWVLYHSIFSQDLSETIYNRMIPNDEWNYNHPIYEYKDLLYQISEELAYQMYKTGNTQLFVYEKEINNIIEHLTNTKVNADISREISERCYALCAYWKADARTGFVEFYHNNIRDFFLAEWIYRHLNQIYIDCYDEIFGLIKNKGNGDGCNYIVVDKLIEFFNEYFPYAPLSAQVCSFIYQRAQSNSKNKKQFIKTWDVSYEDLYILLRKQDFVFAFLDYSIMSTTFQKMLTTEMVCPKDCNLHTNFIISIINILLCTAQVFKYSAEPYLKLVPDRTTSQDLTLYTLENRAKLGQNDTDLLFEELKHYNSEHTYYFKWWVNPEAINENGLLRFIFKKIYANQFFTIGGETIRLLDRSDLSFCNLDNTDLRGIQFSNCRVYGLTYKNAISDEDNNLDNDYKKSKATINILKKCKSSGLNTRLMIHNPLKYVEEIEARYETGNDDINSLFTPFPPKWWK